MSELTESHFLADPADAEALQRLRSGSEQAFTELFRRHGPVTLAFFRRRLGSAEAAAELNQELWMSVARAHASFRGESSFRTWLFRMAHNALSNLRRRWRTHLDERADEPPEGFWEGLHEANADDPVARLDGARQAAGLKRCLAALPENERAVVLGHYFENETLAELTARLSLTNASGARAVLLAAQRRLKRCLEGRAEEAAR